MAYYQRDAALAEIKQRLSANPDDTEALTLRGETLLDAGQRLGGDRFFRAGLRIELRTADPRIAARTAAGRLAVRLRRLSRPPRRGRSDCWRIRPQRAAYLRLMARGLQKVGELASAFDYCQKLIDLDPDQAPLDQISKVLSARRDRWVRNQLAALRGEAKDETAARIDAAVETRWNAALAAGSIDHLQRFLDYFGDQPAAAAARNEWIARLKSAGRLLEAEMAGAGRLDAPSNGADRQPGGQSENAWPLGTVEVVGPGSADASKRGLPNNGDGQLPIEFRGSPGPYFADMSFYFDARGKRRRRPRRLGARTVASRCAAREHGLLQFALGACPRCGHLLLVSLGWRVVAIDTLGTGANGTPRLLWPLSLTGADGESPDLRMVRGRFIMNQPAQMAPFVGPAFQPEMQSYGRSGPLGPLTNRYVCFQRFHSLTAVDPQTGAVLWVRQDVPLGSELFGDSEYVFVVSAHREEATLVRAADGEVLGTRRISRPTEQQAMGGGEERTVFSRLEDAYLAAIGRRLLQWRLTGGEFESGAVRSAGWQGRLAAAEILRRRPRCRGRGRRRGRDGAERPVRIDFVIGRPHDRRREAQAGTLAVRDHAV